MNEPKQVQLNPLVVLDQTARLADIDREAWRNHIMLMAQREYDLTIQNARQAEEIGRLRKILDIALPPELPSEAAEVTAWRQRVKDALATAPQAARAAPVEPPAERAAPTDAEQLEAIRRHAMGED